MKQITALFIILILSLFKLVAQDYKKVDRIVKEYPKSFSKPEKLAGRINNDFTDPYEKSRAIFTWIAHNISYDVKAFLNKKVERFEYQDDQEKNEKIKEIEHTRMLNALKKRKAVCEGYSRLFKELCELSGIECQVVPGWSKTRATDIGKMNRKGDHSWNVIKLNNEWKFIDVTWAAGDTDIEKKKFNFNFRDDFFLMDPDKFFLNHFPADSLWLLTERTIQEFLNLPLYGYKFFSSDIHNISPSDGIIKVGLTDTIIVKLASVDNHEDLGYSFSNDKYLTKPALQKDGLNYLLEIPVNKRRSRYLYILKAGHPIITYKIERER